MGGSATGGRIVVPEVVDGLVAGLVLGGIEVGIVNTVFVFSGFPYTSFNPGNVTTGGSEAADARVGGTVTTLGTELYDGNGGSGVVGVGDDVNPQPPTIATTKAITASRCTYSTPSTLARCGRARRTGG